MPPRAAYTLFMLLAVVVFVLARRCLARSASLAIPVNQQIALAVAAFVGGTLAAKLPFALAADTWYSPEAWASDGKTITTGLIGAYVAVEVAKVALGIQVKTGDAFALPLALALAVGRWGCFFNGCCYGQPTDLPWGVDFGDGVLRHPTQVYESLFHFLMAGVLLMLMQRGWFRTHRLQLYLIIYGVFRFSTESIRPEPAWLLQLTYYQCVALVLIVGPAAQWACESRRVRRDMPAEATPDRLGGDA